MEYQQFAIYCQWNNYERRHMDYARLNSDAEALRRGLMESRRKTRIAGRAAWKGWLDRAMAALRLPRRLPWP